MAKSGPYIKDRKFATILTRQKDVGETTALVLMSVAYARTKIIHYQLATCKPN